MLLNRRDDFPKHFIISAALAAHAGTPLSDAVGVYKEIADSRGGSGFSFGTLPPAARMFFKIDAGMRPIPVSKAATALVSVVPTYLH